jgi:hypothetical protein
VNNAGHGWPGTATDGDESTYRHIYVLDVTKDKTTRFTSGKVFDRTSSWQPR